MRKWLTRLVMRHLSTNAELAFVDSNKRVWRTTAVVLDLEPLDGQSGTIRFDSLEARAVAGQTFAISDMAPVTR